MIERYLFTNQLTLKRYRKFKRDRLALASVWIMGFLFFLSFTAEFWANNKPIIMKYNGKISAPVLMTYHPTEFGREDIFVMDYRSLQFKQDDWAAWPLIQWDPYERNTVVSAYPSAPDKYNLFGTDEGGRDVLTRLLYGLRYTLAFAVGSWFLTYLLGCLLGAIVGYVGGKLDLLGSRVVEIIESIPSFFVLITMIALFSPGLPLLITFMTLFSWTTIYAYMRGQFLALRRRDYVDAARALGASHWRIITKHILPNALTPIVTFAPFTIASNVTILSFMDYLGLGLRPPTPSWGELLSQAQRYFTTAEWLVWAPSGALLLTLTMLINIGLAVRDAFDSKTL
ncbi:MAG: ABC transporter permease subunit [Pseudobdellovibrionaceae bacterium]